MEQTETVMAAAFAAAHVKSPKGRLRDCARFALEGARAGKKAGQMPSRMEANVRLRGYARMAIESTEPNFGAAIGLFLEKLMSDAPAFNELMGRRVHPRAAEYLREVWNEDFQQDSMGQDCGIPAPRNGGGGGHRRSDDQRLLVSAAPSSERQQAARAAMKIRANALMSVELINGKPVRDVTAGEARTWATKQGHKARWIEALCAGLQDDGMVIGDYIDDETAERLWEKSK